MIWLILIGVALAGTALDRLTRRPPNYFNEPWPLTCRTWMKDPRL